MTEQIIDVLAGVNTIQGFYVFKFEHPWETGWRSNICLLAWHSLVLALNPERSILGILCGNSTVVTQTAESSAEPRDVIFVARCERSLCITNDCLILPWWCWKLSIYLRLKFPMWFEVCNESTHQILQIILRWPWVHRLMHIHWQFAADHWFHVCNYLCSCCCVGNLLWWFEVFHYLG